MSQQYLNSSTLAIKSMAILDPGLDSFRLQLEAVIGYKSGFHPTLDAFNASVTMMGSSVPLAFLQVPAIKLLDGATAKVDQRVVLPDVDALNTLGATLLMKEKVNLEIFSKVRSKLRILPKIAIVYNKTVTISGKFPFLEAYFFAIP